jgi:hypothetical protein
MLVEGYKRLRTEDAVPGSSTSYRITVRQLEALVRLSEALARLRCTDLILPQYVKEVTPARRRRLIPSAFLRYTSLILQNTSKRHTPPPSRRPDPSTPCAVPT